jgi:hypothetical protein
VQLQVGYHIIEGKKMPLKKPMAILENVQHDSAAGSGEGSSSSSTHCKVSRSAAQPVLECHIRTGNALSTGAAQELMLPLFRCSNPPAWHIQL